MLKILKHEYECGINDAHLSQLPSPSNFFSLVVPLVVIVFSLILLFICVFRKRRSSYSSDDVLPLGRLGGSSKKRVYSHVGDAKSRETLTSHVNRGGDSTTRRNVPYLNV